MYGDTCALHWHERPHRYKSTLNQCYRFFSLVLLIKLELGARIHSNLCCCMNEMCLNFECDANSLWNDEFVCKIMNFKWNIRANDNSESEKKRTAQKMQWVCARSSWLWGIFCAIFHSNERSLVNVTPMKVSKLNHTFHIPNISRSYFQREADLNARLLLHFAVI